MESTWAALSRIHSRLPSLSSSRDITLSISLEGLSNRPGLVDVSVPAVPTLDITVFYLISSILLTINPSLSSSKYNGIDISRL